MKKIYKLMTSAMIIVASLGLLPIGVNAEFKSDSKGRWLVEGDSYATGWRQVGRDWYLFGSDGYAKSGWVYDNGNWYYFYPGVGDMLYNTYIDGYYLGSNGAWTDDKTNAKVTEAAVQATKEMKNKVEALGWVQDGIFINDEVSLKPSNKADGTIIDTTCKIKNGVPTVYGVTTSQNFDDWNEDKKNETNKVLTVDEYMKDKNEGKIGKFTYYSELRQGNGDDRETHIKEYLVK